MTAAAWFITGALAFIGLAVLAAATALDQANKHLSNIADRLLDIEAVLKKGR